jgi:hypothetical protein
MLSDELSASTIYEWSRRWQRRHDGRRINQRERWSIVRILETVAVRAGRAKTIGRPWLWRLRNSVPEGEDQPPEAIV